MEAGHLGKLWIQFEWTICSIRGYETGIGEGIFMPQDRTYGNHFALEMAVKAMRFGSGVMKYVEYSPLTAAISGTCPTSEPW